MDHDVAEKAEKIEDVANDVDAADKKKAAEQPPTGKEPETAKGDPPVIEGKLEDLVSWQGNWF